MGTVAYKLKLPATSSIHPVFHVSQLKKMAPGTEVISAVPDDIDLLCVPEKVLRQRVVTKGTQSIIQVMVQWSDWPKELATWEDLLSRSSKCSRLHLLGDKQAFVGRGMIPA